MPNRKVRVRYLKEKRLSQYHVWGFLGEIVGHLRRNWCKSDATPDVLYPEEHLLAGLWLD